MAEGAVTSSQKKPGARIGTPGIVEDRPLGD
jgi:hypothetical protein